MAITEYDAFGPWIYEITDKHPLPPQFETQVEEHDYEILIKYHVILNVEKPIQIWLCTTML